MYVYNLAINKLRTLHLEIGENEDPRSGSPISWPFFRYFLRFRIYIQLTSLIR